MAFKKVLVAVDFSEPSREALRGAAQIATERDTELVLVHVWEPKAHLYGLPPFPVSSSDEYVQHANAQLDDAKREAERIGAKRVSTLVLTGIPWHEVVELLRSFDLVVVGTHGRTGLRHVLLGSIAERIVRHAPAPVLVLRTRE